MELVKESHLLLYRPVDSGVAGMQAHNELAPVVELFHQDELLFQVHICRTAYGGSRFRTIGQFFWDEAAGVQDQVCLFEHPPATYRDQLRIARTGTDYFDMALPLYGFIHCHGKCIIVAFSQLPLLFLQQQESASGTLYRRGFRHAR